ncbi:TPA: winged helix-turn-helix domain-containing protein [Serratia odorifera]|uniref:transcriptional regulator n=1 Tax=Serratia sp. BIGb0234 TaxID=2940614 RepID=UPI000FBC331E|nr:winged helix-turn-helix domain-containing protein [Serratia sp. BIGb0234]MCS4319610.1 DNA-binding winged helix-turn-helix (wHTH) protein [Serratia sp. BIGb0234]
MKYIINLTIVFDPEGRILMLRNNNQLTVGLSNPATRLLNELIKNNKVELTRETLIKHVWEDYGFSPSSATLSNHISELRKAFEVLGVSKNILITVPRIGFKMEAEIHPETKALKEKELAATEKIEMIPPSLELVSEGNTAPPLIDAKSEKTPYRMKKSVLFLTLALVSIATATAFVVLTRDDEPTLVDVQDKCNIYTLDDNKQSTELSDKARKMLVSEKIDCTQANRDIFYMEARPANELLKVHFMAACTKNDNMNYKNCNNYKSVE